MDAAQETEESRKRALLTQLVGAVYAMERLRARRQAKTGSRKRDIAKRLLQQSIRCGKILWDSTQNFAAQELVAAAAADAEDNARLLAAHELGYVDTTDGHDQQQQAEGGAGPTKRIWYAVFTKAETCCCTFGPAVVVAVRGTRVSNLEDILADMNVLGQALHEHRRVPHLRRVVKQAVSDYGSANVCITGHSLGAALALLVARDLAGDQEQQPVEAHLFNPPFSSFDWVRSSAVRRGEKVAKAVMLKMQAAACAVTSSRAFVHDLSQQLLPRLEEIEEQFWALARWLPHLYLHPWDPISWGYINFFDDHEMRIQSERAGAADLRAQIHAFVAPHTLSSLLSWFTSPKHLIPSAVLVVAHTSRPAPSACYRYLREAHGLKQWENSHMPVSLRRIQSFNKHKHKLGQQQGVAIEVHSRELNLTGLGQHQQDDSCHEPDQEFLSSGDEKDCAREEQVEGSEESGSTSEEEEEPGEDDAHAAQDLKDLENLFSRFGL